MSRPGTALPLVPALLAVGLLVGCSGSKEPETADGAPTAPAVEAPADDAGDLAPGRSDEEAERLASEARSDLEAAEAILGRPGDEADEEMAAVVRDLVDQARAALAQDDLERARNLAHKARTLAEDL